MSQSTNLICDIFVTKTAIIRYKSIKQAVTFRNKPRAVCLTAQGSC
jgi:hypothetical protein